MSCLDDATVLGLVEGRLTPELIAHVDEHIDSCASCRQVVTLVAGSRSQVRVLSRGDNVGRYVVGDLLGAGAMGRVYSAWEPELDRRVAIKVLHEAGNRERLVKEAQAMARLNHPNIVTVHEVGSTEAGVFVAMELVDGNTLRAWAGEPHEWRERVRVLAEAARGLAAVHAAGVVHRDIKPDNVIVGADGRVRLGDFGLARSGTSASTTPAPTGFALGTISGGTAVAGTPAYMAPELLRGGAANAASDQFSFGVMAYELVAGKRPFEGATWAELLRSIDEHDVRRLPDVPAWLDDIVQRCIALEPAARHESMLAVAEAFAKRMDRRGPMKWGSVALAAAALASGATWFVARSFDGNLDKADNTPNLTAIWNADARQVLAARGVTPAALVAVDRWTTSWSDEARAAQQATKRDNADRVAARERCLDQRRAEIAALLHAAVETPDRLLDAVGTLPAPAECRNADADPLPLDPRRAEAVKEVLERLPSIRAAVAMGNPERRYVTEQLVERAYLGEHQPTLAEALLVRAEALRIADQLDEAAIAARNAVGAAERGHADVVRARAWLARVAIAGDQRNLVVADDLGAVAAAAIDRIGAPQLQASLARLRGLVAYNRGQLTTARELLAAARQQFVALGGERTLDVAAVDSALGSVARAAGDLDEAERLHRSVLALDRELRGANHRDIARDLHNIAGVLRLRGDLDHALATYREALAVEVATQGERSVAAGLTHNSIGLVELARKDFTAAETDFTTARDIFTAANHGDAAFAEHNLGLVAQARGDHRTALGHFAIAASLYGKTIGTDALAPMRLDLDRARSEAAVGDKATARKHATTARDRAKAAEVTWLADDASAFLASTPAATPVAAVPVRPVAVEPTPAARPPPATSPVPTKPQPKKDVGVYGSAQTW